MRSLSLLALASAANAFCPWHGPVFPQPRNLASSATFQTALEKLKSAYDNGIVTGNSSTGTVPDDSAAAFQVFSVHSDDPLFEWYHDGKILNTTVGVKTLDGDSVLRIASISKLLTVYLVLKELGDGWWDVPISDVIPELKGHDGSKKNQVDFVNWREVTIGSLAGQISGIPKDYMYVEAGRTLINDPTLAKQVALPPLEDSERPVCVLPIADNEGLTCTREEFFANLDTRQPVRHPNSSPGYDNTAYIILGYALETLTGHSFEESLQLLSDALELTATSVDPPEVSRGAILQDLLYSGFKRTSGEGAPTGGVYSSMNDLSQIGRSILGSTVLDPNTTRAWLQPTAFTSDLRGALGRPWEIYRVDTKSSRGVIDLFSKGGDWGLYHTKLVLVPDYNIGMTVFVGGPGEKDWFNDQVIDIMFPALEEVAREEADAAFAGTYTGTSNGTDVTITFTTEAGKPGLGIEKWVHNGTDLIAALSELRGQPLTTENWRLLPTGLEQEFEDGTTQISWRALIDNPNPYRMDSVFSACDSWFGPEDTVYGQHTIDQILFTVDSARKTTKVDLRAWKVELTKEG